mmetsp:Transcript_12761/g.19309  ORF Transcript_12761/g.19309 Transcript_12761/m.19309 type:complete len:228 (+) Transcript_12761:2674-3357(+)
MKSMLKIIGSTSTISMCISSVSVILIFLPKLVCILVMCWCFVVSYVVCLVWKCNVLYRFFMQQASVHLTSTLVIPFFLLHCSQWMPWLKILVLTATLLINHLLLSFVKSGSLIRHHSLSCCRLLLPFHYSPRCQLIRCTCLIWRRIPTAPMFFRMCGIKCCFLSNRRRLVLLKWKNKFQNSNQTQLRWLPILFSSLVLILQNKDHARLIHLHHCLFMWINLLNNHHF